MIIQGKKAGFSTATVILNSEDAQRIAEHRQDFDLIEIISHEKLELSEFTCREKTTGIVDLTSPDEIFATFNKTTRNEIARTQRDTAFSTTYHPHSTDDGYALYIAFERAASRKPYSREVLTGVSEFLAYDGEKLVSGIFVYFSKPIMRIRSIFSARHVTENHERYQRVGYATRRLVFEVCKWGVENGYTGLDLASVNTTNAETRSISEFKMGFTPRIIPEYIYGYTSGRYRAVQQLINAIRSIRKMW